MKPVTYTYAAPPQGRAIAAFLAIPALLCIAIVALWSIKVGDMPQQVATHFGTNNVADGFTARENVAWVNVAISLSSTALMLGIGAYVKFRGPIARILSGTATFITGTMLGVLVTTTLPQIGLASATGLKLPWHALPTSLAVGAVGGVVAAALMPHTPRVQSESTAMPQLKVEPGASLAYSTTVTFGGWLIIMSVVMLLAGPTLVVFTQQWTPGVILLVAALAISSMYRINLTIGANGVRARSWLGFSLRHIPLNQISGASAPVQGPAELGGWGYRFTTTGSGISTGHGPTLRIHRTSGSDWFCSLPDAAHAAATANALVSSRSSTKI